MVKKLLLVFLLVLLVTVVFYLSRIKEKSIETGEKSNKTETLGSLLTLQVKGKKVDILINNDIIFVNPFENVEGTLGSFEIIKSDSNCLFEQRENGFSFLRADVAEISSRSFLLITNNKPDHGAYSIDCGIVYDLENGESVYVSPNVINGYFPWLSFEGESLALSSYTEECNQGRGKYDGQLKELYEYKVSEGKFIKTEEKCID